MINGKTDATGATGSIAALNEFYAGFNGRDVQRSMQSWARTDEVVMCNPIGGIRKGWGTIQQAYQRIMQGQTQVYVEFYDYQLISGADLFIAVGRERGYARHAGVNLELAIRTSRVFRLFGNSWRQVHHHGSIDDPGLLLDYQKLINR